MYFVATNLWRAPKRQHRRSLLTFWPYCSVASSKIIRFLVGPEKQEYTVHTAAVSHHSPALKAMVDSNFKESIDHTVQWEDVDELVFLSFWRFLYTGDYQEPKMSSAEVPLGNQQTVEAEEAKSSPQHVDYGWVPAHEGGGYLGKMGRMKEKIAVAPRPMASSPFFTDQPSASKSGMLWQDFVNSWDVSQSELPSEGDKTHEQSNSLGETLFHHAKVYVLADRYLMTRLMDLALGKLHQGLVGLATENDQSLDDVAALLSFCFRTSVPTRLRELLVHYAGCKVESLWKAQQFRDLVEESGEFSKALVEKMLLRLE
jgi:hypothetical protein